MAPGTSGGEETAFLCKENLHFAEVGDEFYMVSEDVDVVVCMNPPAFAVMENLDGFTSPEEIGVAMAETGSLDRAEAVKAVNQVCRQLLELGIVQHVKRRGGGRPKRLRRLSPLAAEGLPAILQSWQGEELRGGLFVNFKDDDIHVIVPNVTDGPIKTCPPHTCTIPAGLFTPEGLIRVFDPARRKAYDGVRMTGLVHLE